MQDRETVQRIHADELKRRLDAGEGLRLVDVRAPEEFDDWHLPGAVNVPLDRLVSDPSAVPAGGDVVTVCMYGMRSETARDALVARGVRARSLAGGMVAWNSVYDVAEVQAPPVRVVQFRRVGKGCLAYMVVADGEALVVDPTVDVDVHVQAAKAAGARIVHVVDTHAHADHASGGRLLAEATGATYRATDEVDRTPHETLRDGDALKVGRAEVRVLATPGHTPGSVTLLLGDLAFTGDTLFVEGVGRPDLGQDPAPNAETLWDTLRARVLALPDATRVLPGHHGESVATAPGRTVEARLGDLRRALPALGMEKPAFVAWVLGHMTAQPGNFKTIKDRNRGRVEIDDVEDLRELEAGPNRCAVKG